MSSIVIVTSGQPSANPRVVKEATALDSAGYNVTVIYAPLSPWADKFDLALFASTPSVKWIRAGCHSLQQPFQYKLVRLRRKLYEWLFKYASFVNVRYQYAFVLYAQELEARCASLQADLYIGHNLGALPAVVYAAKKWKATCGFDAEDYHRGEDVPGSIHYSFAVNIENKFIPQLSYLSTASPLITEAYVKHYSPSKIFTINNVFSKKFLQNLPNTIKEELSLFWFSQTVGTNRGLEIIIEALNELSHLNISLHILGDCSPAYKQELINLSVKPLSLNFITPKSLEEIFKIATQYDIGIASEIPYCESRDICLTNKLFTYLLAGNFILASNTKAQKKFLSDYAGVGLLYKYNNVTDLATKIEQLYNDKRFVFKCRQRTLEIAERELNWEMESKILLSNVASFFSGN